MPSACDGPSLQRTGQLGKGSKRDQFSCRSPRNGRACWVSNRGRSERLPYSKPDNVGGFQLRPAILETKGAVFVAYPCVTKVLANVRFGVESGHCNAA